MVSSGYLKQGDVLVIDNAKLHCSSHSEFIAEALWSEYRIAVLFLPANCPEWNPIEKIFNYFTQVLKHENPRRVDNNLDRMFLHLCSIALDHISRETIVKMFKECGYVGLLSMILR